METRKTWVIDTDAYECSHAVEAYDILAGCLAKPKNAGDIYTPRLEAEWSTGCTKPRQGEFGGGAVRMYPDRCIAGHSQNVCDLREICDELVEVVKAANSDETSGDLDRSRIESLAARAQKIH